MKVAATVCLVLGVVVGMIIFVTTPLSDGGALAGLTVIGVGPRAAYHLRRSPWLPFAGVSFLYLNNSVALLGEDWLQTGWKLKAGLGVSPVVGSRGALPVELGYSVTSLVRDFGEGGTETVTTHSFGLDIGLGFFLGR